MMSAEATGARGVALDLDGVLIDGMPFHIEAWEYSLAGSGLTATSDELYELEGIPTAEVVGVLADRQSVSISVDARRNIASAKRERRGVQALILPLDLAHTLTHRGEQP
jgi:beta-phosphoglucomutase-like phosphatase (HAD superfamily)